MIVPSNSCREILNLPFENEFDLAVTVGSSAMFLAAKNQVVGQVARLCLAAVCNGHREHAPLSSPLIAARSFNGQCTRNWLIRPPFIMFYLTFLTAETKHAGGARLRCSRALTTCFTTVSG
jgi:hypothetical protein